MKLKPCITPDSLKGLSEEALNCLASMQIAELQNSLELAKLQLQADLASVSEAERLCKAFGPELAQEIVLERLRQIPFVGSGTSPGPAQQAKPVSSQPKQPKVKMALQDDEAKRMLKEFKADLHLRQDESLVAYRLAIVAKYEEEPTCPNPTKLAEELELLKQHPTALIALAAYKFVTEYDFEHIVGLRKVKKAMFDEYMTDDFDIDWLDMYNLFNACWDDNERYTFLKHWENGPLKFNFHSPLEWAAVRLPKDLLRKFFPHHGDRASIEKKWETYVESGKEEDLKAYAKTVASTLEAALTDQAVQKRRIWTFEDICLELGVDHDEWLAALTEEGAGDPAWPLHTILMLANKGKAVLVYKKQPNGDKKIIDYVRLKK